MLGLVSLQLSANLAMRIHEFFTEEFATDNVGTEHLAYQLLKKDPLHASVSYVAIPWAVLINKKQLDRVEKLNLKVANGFAICQHIKYEDIIPLLKKMGVKTLFTPHAIREKVYDGVEVVAFPHLAANGIEGAINKDVWYSFIGCSNTHPVRKVLFGMQHPVNTIIIERKLWHWANAFKPGSTSVDQQQAEALEYQEALARSRFSLCPRGTGASTIRFWESLQAGAIPVLFADAMTLPEGFDWDSCVIKIAEKEVKNLGKILSTISLEREAEMRIQCVKAYELFSEENFVRCIRLHFEDQNNQF
jgi:hypothetical protein